MQWFTFCCDPGLVYASRILAEQRYSLLSWSHTSKLSCMFSPPVNIHASCTLSQEISFADNRPAGVSYQMLWLLISSSNLTCLAQNGRVIFRICCRVLINNSLQHREPIASLKYWVAFFAVIGMYPDCLFLPCCAHFRGLSTLNHTPVSDTEVPLPLCTSLVEVAAEIPEPWEVTYFCSFQDTAHVCGQKIISC